VKIYFPVVLLIIFALILMPVSASSENTTNTTVVLTTTQQPVTPLVENTTTVPTTAVMTTIAAATTTATVPSANVTSAPQTTTAAPSQNITVATTAAPVVSPVPQGSTGNLTVASSPLGASVLIDGVYSGVTPGDISGIAGGNHIVRLTLSGYYDYEGTIYVVPGQVTHVYGTLPPLNGHGDSATQAPAATPVPVVTVQPTATSASSPLENPTVIAAIIGIITASIGATATLYPHIAKKKKE